MQRLAKSNKLRWAFASTTGTVAWFIHLVVIYAIGEFFCEMAGQNRWLGYSATQWSVALSTLVLFALTLVASLIAHLERKKLRSYPDSEGLRGAQFLMTAGLISNLFFAFVIAYEAVPILFLGGEC